MGPVGQKRYLALSLRSFPSLLVMLSLGAAACAGGRRAATLPDLPTPSTEGFLPAVRQQIDEAYKQAMANPNDAEACGQYGMVLQAYEQAEPARRCYERACGLDPKAFRWLYYRAILENIAGERTAAIRTLRNALKLQESDLPARLMLSSILLNAGALEESRTIAQRAAKEAPQSAHAHYTLGRVEAALHENAAAAEELQKACQIAPDYAASHYALALAYRDLGHTAEARQHMDLYEKNRKAPPPLEDPLLQEVDRLNSGALVRLGRAEQLMNEGRLEEAAAEYERALEIERDDKWIHTALISTYSRMKQWDKAESHYRAAIALDPDFSKAHFNYGLLRAELGDFPAAVAALQKALASDPSDASAHKQLGRVYERLGEPGKAAQQYRLALENDPNDSTARALLAGRLLAEGNHREAIGHMVRLLVAKDVRPEDARELLRRAYSGIGDARVISADLRDARQHAVSSGGSELVAAIDAELARIENPSR